MGQQQLLLLVLATVIVGLATVAGIQAFEQGQTRANQDALTSTAVKIASDAQARIKEPSQFGGYNGDISTAASSVTLEELGYNAETATSGFSELSGDVYVTSDGECSIEDGGSDDILVTCESEEAWVQVTVDGTDPENIETTDGEIKS